MQAVQKKSHCASEARHMACKTLMLILIDSGMRFQTGACLASKEGICMPTS